MTNKTTYTISNLAGGDARTFRLGLDGHISDASIRHADRIGFGGPVFGGPAADDAAAQYEQVCADRAPGGE